MGVLDWITGTGRKTVAAKGGSSSGGSARYEITAGLIFINGRDFVGSYSRSPNGRFILAWRDANDAGTRGGARANGHGRYILIDGDAIVAEGRVERPNDGKVADTGVFILNDWLFFSERLEAFSSPSRRTARRSCRAGSKPICITTACPKTDGLQPAKRATPRATTVTG